MNLLAAVLFVTLQGGGAAAADSAPASRPVSILEQMDREYRHIAERLRAASVTVVVEFNDPQTPKLEFSGTLVNGRGHVAIPAAGVSNYEDINKIYIRTAEARTYGARLLTFYPFAPVAIIELQPGNAQFPKAPEIGARGSLQIGDTVGVVANMLGLECTSVFGNVSGMRRKLLRFPGVELIQTNVDSVAGNGTQGATVGNRRGEVVGVMLGGSELADWAQVTVFTFNSSQNSQGENTHNNSGARDESAKPGGAIANPAPPAGPRSGSFDLSTAQSSGQVVRTEMRSVRAPGVSLVLPIENIIDFVEARKFEPVSPRNHPLPVVGFVLNERIDALTRSQLRLAPDEGLFVEEVLEGMPAQLAGIINNDIITKVGGEPVVNNSQFREQLGRSSTREKVTLEIVRGGERRHVEIRFSDK